MIAETLLNWDKTELAEVLASEYAEPDDLIEAFPAIAKAGTMEEDLLEEFIERNWKIILSIFNVDALLKWVEDKELKERWEQMHSLNIEIEHEYDEYVNEEFCKSVLYSAMLFNDTEPENLGVLIKRSIKS